MNNMIVDYSSSPFQMGDLLMLYAVDFEDFSYDEKKSLWKYLERYMKTGTTESVVIDLHKVKLRLKGADEISYLYQYVAEGCDKHV